MGHFVKTNIEVMVLFVSFRKGFSAGAQTAELKKEEKIKVNFGDIAHLYWLNQIC